MSTWPCSSCGEVISPDGHDALMVGDVRFHHACLKCQVCQKNMEGKAVTLDRDNRLYCTQDYNRKDGQSSPHRSSNVFSRIYSIMCANCDEPIVPKKGKTKAPRIRALGKDFYLACFKCEVNECGFYYL